MKTKLKFHQWLIMPILLICIISGIRAQGPYPNTGNDAVCLNSTHSYGVINTEGSTYAWSINLPAGGTITGNGNNTISILWETTGNYILDVTETNNSGCSFTIASIEVIVSPLPVPGLSGPSPVCFNSTGNVYTTEAGMTNYVWTIVGGSITTGGTSISNTVTVTWNGVGPYSLSVNYSNSNGCTAAIPATFPVLVHPLPVVTLTGASPVCLNSTGNIYTTDAGMTNYTWIVAGGTITAGGTSASNTATISWDGVGPYTVSVNYNNANGCSATNPTILPVTIITLPIVALTGPSPVCLNSIDNVYTTDIGMSNYTWIIMGGTITAGGLITNNTATLTWDGVGPYSVSINYNMDGCSSTVPTVIPITVNTLPAASPIYHN